MYRYPCKFCHKTVIYGERHPCLFHRNGDYVYSLPEPRDKGNAGLDEEPERLPENLNESFDNQFPSAQQKNTDQSGQLCGRLAESDIHDEITLNTKLSNSLQNIHSSFAHSTEIQTTNFGNSSENLKPIHRTDGRVRGAAKRKSRPKKIVHKQSERSVNEAILFHVESCEKCRVSDDKRLCDISMNGKPLFCANLKSHNKGKQLNLEDNCEASSSLPRVVFPNEFEEANAISTADSLDPTGEPISSEVTPNDRNASGHSISTFEEPRHFMGDSNCVAGPSSRNMQFRKDPVIKKFICDVCHKEFDHKSYLVIHYRKHTGEKPFVCDVCNREFSQKPNLKVHSITHTGDKPFVCTVCKKAFTKKVSLKRHSLTHTGEKPSVCNVCNKGFTQKADLKRHRLTHTGEKPFVCDVCQKGFSEKGSLKTHCRLHTGEKLYVCDVCEASFSYKYQLDSHLEIHSCEKHEF